MFSVALRLPPSLPCLAFFAFVLLWTWPAAVAQEATPQATPAVAVQPVKPSPTPTPPDPAWFARFDVLTYQKGDYTLPYRLLKPDKIEEGKVYPLILFFHGVGECGTNNTNQLKNSVGEIIKRADKKEPFFMLVPQSRGWWVGVPWNLDSHVMPEKLTPSMEATIELLDKIKKEFPVDPKRIYVIGLSMGGLGAWDIISRLPDEFAAAVPVCGAGDTAQAPKLVHLPIWAFHGGADTVVKTHRSRDMIEAIQKAGGNPKYTEIPNGGHGAWGPAFSNQELYDWLFAQVKK